MRKGNKLLMVDRHEASGSLRTARDIEYVLNGTKLEFVTEVTLYMAQDGFLRANIHVLLSDFDVEKAPYDE